MKKDLNNKITRFNQEMIYKVTNTFIDLLTRKNFNDISVKEICKITDYPRGTFYNYFFDLKDLLIYVFSSWKDDLHLEDLDSSDNDFIFHVFDRLYTFLDDNRYVFEKIINKNNLESAFFYAFNRYFREEIANYIQKNNYEDLKDLPIEICQDYYADVIILVLKYAFFVNKDTTKEEAQKYLVELLHVNKE